MHAERKKAREIAMQILYSIEMDKKSLDDILKDKMFSDIGPERRNYAEELVKGVLAHNETYMAEIRELSLNWEIGRMPKLDQIVIKLAMHEMTHMGDVPLNVSINEAINLAKKFSTDHSGAFVNGILDGYQKKILNKAGDKS